MKASHQSPDPLLQILAEEASCLPAHAAMEARKRSTQRRQNRQRVALMASVFLFGVVSWSFLTSHEKSSPSVSAPPVSSHGGPSDSKATTGSLNALKIEVTPTEKQALSPTLPDGLDAEQTALVKAAGDLPILLVRDDTGKVTRVLLVER